MDLSTIRFSWKMGLLVNKMLIYKDNFQQLQQQHRCARCVLDPEGSEDAALPPGPQCRVPVRAGQRHLRVAASGGAPRDVPGSKGRISPPSSPLTSCFPLWPLLWELHQERNFPRPRESSLIRPSVLQRRGCSEAGQDNAALAV